MQRKSARVTSKGQITIPADVRRELGLRTGDEVVFQKNKTGYQLSARKATSVFAKYAGIGIPGIEPTREGIIAYVRSLRDS